MTKREAIETRYGQAMDYLSLFKRNRKDTISAVLDFLDFIEQKEDRDWIYEMFSIIHMIIAQTEKILIEKYSKITKKSDQDIEKIFQKENSSLEENI